MAEAVRIVITPTDNGSYRVVGPVTISDATGTVLDETEEVYLCRCGNSNNKPFCDGSHRTCGFESRVRASGSY